MMPRRTTKPVQANSRLQIRNKDLGSKKASEESGVVLGLIGEKLASTTISIDKITLSKSQPRKYFDAKKQIQLVESIKIDGILQPLLVRPKGKGYELVAGERRYRAAQEVGLTEVPVNVKELTDEQAQQYALVENLQREDLNPVEETEGILSLLELRFGATRAEVISLLDRMLNEKRGITSNVTSKAEKAVVEQVFDSIGRLSLVSFRTNRLPLLNLPKDILEALRGGRLEYTKAKAIASVKDEKKRQQLLKVALAEELSLSQIRQMIQSLKSIDAKEPVGQEELTKYAAKVSSKLRKSPRLIDPQVRQKVQRLLRQIEKELG